MRIRWGTLFSTACCALVAIFVSLYLRFVPENPNFSKILHFSEDVVLSRQNHVMHINAQTMRGMWAGMGYSHAKDRLVQMYSLKVAAQGRLSELFKNDVTSNKIDIFLRKLRFYDDAKELWDSGLKDDPEVQSLKWYAEGVNKYLEEISVKPLEFFFVNFSPWKHPWHPVDSLASCSLLQYVGLAETYYDIEKVIIQAIHGGINAKHLASIFKPHLDPLLEDLGLIEIIKKLNFSRHPVPGDVDFMVNPISLRNGGSNNWVIGPKKSLSGSPVLACDPHMNVGRLPSFWYETAGKIGDLAFFGSSLPGIPGILFGRTNYTAYGLTSGFADQSDFFIEKIEKGKYLAGDKWEIIHQRVEKIIRKSEKPLCVVFFSTRNGILDIDPVVIEESEIGQDHSLKLADGYYLVFRLSVSAQGSANSVKAFSSGPYNSKSTTELMSSFKKIALSANYLIADSFGNIGLQQTGLAPRRNSDWNGFYPARGWLDENIWDGLHDDTYLISESNPERGFIATANNDIAAFLDKPINKQISKIHMGNARVSRVYELLQSSEKIGLDYMIEMQNDTLSVLGRNFLESFHALLLEHEPKSNLVSALLNWDLRMEPESREATLAMQLLELLLDATYGDNIFGKDAWDFLKTRTTVGFEFYWWFTQGLFQCRECDDFLYGSLSKNEVFERSLEKLLSKYQTLADVRPWGEENEYYLINAFFQGALPDFLGFDSGPHKLRGGRDAIVQAFLVKPPHGPVNVCGQVWRFITDMGTNKVISSLPGGPSGRRLSGLYTSGVQDYFAYKYNEYELH